MDYVLILLGFLIVSILLYVALLLTRICNVVKSTASMQLNVAKWDSAGLPVPEYRSGEPH